MTTVTKVKFHLVPVAAVAFAALIVFGFWLIRPSPIKPVHRPHFLSYGFYNMRTLQFTMQYAYDAQLQGQHSMVTVQITCAHVLRDTAVCHAVPSNGAQPVDMAVQVTRHGNDFKVSQYR